MSLAASPRTLADAALPRSGALRDALLVLSGSLVVALGAQVAIPLPFTPVPLTGQTYAALLVGAALGARRGVLALLLYLAEGALGLPVFAGGAAGLARLGGPTGGYLAGLVLAALLVGWFADRGWDRRPLPCLLAMIAGSVAIYACGVPWLALTVGADRAVAAGLLPFLPGDALKLALAALSLPLAWRLVR